MSVLQNRRVLDRNRRRWGGPQEPWSQHRFGVSSVVSVADLPSVVDIGLRQLLRNHHAAGIRIEFAAQMTHLPHCRIGRARHVLQHRVVSGGVYGALYGGAGAMSPAVAGTAIPVGATDKASLRRKHGRTGLERNSISCRTCAADSLVRHTPQHGTWMHG